MSHGIKRAEQAALSKPASAEDLRTFKLSVPITREDGSVLGEIRLRSQESMTLGDLLAIERNMRAPTELERAFAMVCRLSGLDRDEIELISAADAQPLFEFLGADNPKSGTPTETS